ncbi:MAG TPA: AraC family transcriptional regulator [Xanthobacteraceae bacterium]|nr:AraC family transcriptional regulator [Xanthobacteraceae bacterium]
MNPVQKALWYVESHLREPIALEDVASRSGVSPYHLTRAFDAVTGHSLMRYVRARRLSEAARELCRGAPDILAVALDAGYGSHEAFTRAFRDQFGLTPEQLRGRGQLDALALMEPIVMDSTPMPDLAPPRFETTKPLLLAGIVARYNRETSAAIPSQWQKLQPYLGHLPQQVGRTAYGACYNTDEDGNFDYMCGVEVGDFSDLPAGFGTLRVPAQRYAVFHQREHISSIRRTFSAIWSQWLPESGHKPADAPTLERYGAEFNGATGTGGFEIWIPIEA